MQGAAPAGDGGGNHVQVNVVNNSPNTEIQTTKRREGNIDIHDIIVKVVGDKLAGGAFDGPMRARFGQAVQPRSR
jgi:hypothetical protein